MKNRFLLITLSVFIVASLIIPFRWLRESRREQQALEKIISFNGEYLFDHQIGAKEVLKLIKPTFQNCLTNDVQMVSLVNTNIKSDDVQLLLLLPNLKTVWLANTDIDDDSLKYLIQLKQLEELGIEETNISSRGITQLERELPNTIILKQHYTPYLP
ncbi:MAG: hypothetical protein COA78_04365 [Blastopirellula sp.]|nr:MAG: hypothetical protein COA78_04365 [Blastopirellula sp.]